MPKMTRLNCFIVSFFIVGTMLTAANMPAPVDKKKPVPKANTVAKETPAQALSKLIDAVQKQYNSTKLASSDFEQSYKHPFIKVTENSKGMFKYSRDGGKMLWSYTEPKDRQKKFFINGHELTYYAVSDKVAYINKCFKQDTLSSSVAFLFGTGDLKSSFTIALLEGESPNPQLTWLELIPKEANSPVKKLFLGVNKEAKVLESLVEDPSGGKNHFKFINFTIEKAIANDVFVFTPPKGIAVKPLPNVQCPEEPVKPVPAKVEPKPAPKAAVGGKN